MTPLSLTLGAIPLSPGQCAFRVWAPAAQLVDLHLVSPLDRVIPMRKDQHGFHFVLADDVLLGADYLYRLDGNAERPDPASRWQPAGVHGPSRIAQPQFEWTDTSWFGLPLRDYVLYELHVGTFSAQGTFDGVIAHLQELKDLGVTALELMPVAQFPGARNWGYDGVFPFAVQNTYGGPPGLKRLVNAAHALGMAVVLDVVFNHLGPEGNYLAQFAPYFTNQYATPWGAALNFDGPHSDEVRRFFTENALYWQTAFHIDALRLDAVHAIRDFSAVPFLEELTESCHRQAEALNRRFHLIAESDMNMARHILPRALGGYGLDAQWSDDFHHGLHVLLTGERNGYYSDFSGVSQFSKAWRQGYAFTGEYSHYRRRSQGSDPARNPVKQFVVCSQNHDQIGNRMLGDRPGAVPTHERLKLAAGAVLLSPFIPLLFMGEEYGETAPFQYFVSHTEPALIEAVRHGRSREFAAFGWKGKVPDPQDEATFQLCKLNHSLASQGWHRTLRELYRELLTMRRQMPALSNVEKHAIETTALETDNVLMVHQWNGDQKAVLVFNFANERRILNLAFPKGEWRKRMDSADTRWGGPGSTAADPFSSKEHPSLEIAATSFLVYFGI